MHSHDNYYEGLLVQAAKSATSLIQSLIEGTTPIEPKFGNICGSGKNPAQLFSDLFESIYRDLKREADANRGVVRPPESGQEKKWESKWDKLKV